MVDTVHPFLFLISHTTSFLHLLQQFRAAVVGYGSSNVDPRLTQPLTTDPALFAAGVRALTTSGSREPAFLSLARIAQDTLGTPIDGGDGSTFPGEIGFCSILFTDERSNGDPLEFDEVQEVVSALTSPSGLLVLLSALSHPSCWIRATTISS